MTKERSGYGRTWIGEENIRKKRTNSFSKRAAKGRLEVVKRRCDHCGHDKELNNISSMGYVLKKRCSRCKKDV